MGTPILLSRAVLLLAPALWIIPMMVLRAGISEEKPTNPETMRTVVQLHKPMYTEIGGLSTWEVIPSPGLEMEALDPFLFLNDHGPQVYPPNNEGLPFGPHPHKGFETITFILDGDLVHRDNTGYVSAIKAGGVQWMTAGKGIIHSEISSDEFKQKGGNIEMLQLWVNLPKRLKETDPGYIGLQANDIPAIDLGVGAKLNLISGEYQGSKGPVNSLTGLWMSTLEMKAGAGQRFEVDPSRQVFFYVTKGQVMVNGEKVGGKALVRFGTEGSIITVNATEDAVILFGHGSPTGEPIVARGPFVMNTEEEIRQAWKDYQQGRFGKPLDH
ncbi:MAG TPA: pirin family protein [Bacteroidales bacterium]|nr:pirin family protein [Bacteroidales bacterium]